MGRGRAKAKQTKVARELKYSSHETDFDALQRELSQSEQDAAKRAAADGDEQQPEDPDSDGYDKYRR